MCGFESEHGAKYGNAHVKDVIDKTDAWPTWYGGPYSREDILLTAKELDIEVSDDDEMDYDDYYRILRHLMDKTRGSSSE